METAITLTEKDFIRKDESLWMTAELLGKWLGYKSPNSAIGMILKRHETELAPFTCINKLLIQGQERDVRLFDEQGCYILAMHANTPEALRFRYELSLFLKQLRINSGRFAELFEKYDRLRISCGVSMLKNALFEQYRLRSDVVDRIIELMQILSADEISRLYSLSVEWVGEFLRSYENILNDKESDNKPVNDWPALLGTRRYNVILSKNRLERNMEVMNLFGAGMNKSEIARRLDIHRNTVSTVLKNNVEVSHVSQ